MLEFAPRAGSEHPPIPWGDRFVCYAPDAEIPGNRQPSATIVTKNHPDDTGLRLDAPGRWHLSIHVRPALFADLIGHTPGSWPVVPVDFSEADVFLPHPLHGHHGWVAVVDPGPRTIPRALPALREAHLADQRRVERRQEPPRG